MNTPHAFPAPVSLDDAQAARALLSKIKTEVSKAYKGPSSTIDLIMVALLGGGHVLLEGVPGVAKTTLVKSISQALGCEMKRIQFTPDLLPQDITGTYVLDPRTGQFSLRRGPLFAGVVLADEINRAPARTQSALLEAMQERQVTLEGERLPLPDPFFVLATQNPLDLEGTYPLPEAQLDRFLIFLELGYPSHEDEVAMLRAHGVASPATMPLLNPQQCRHLRTLAAHIHVEEDLLQYAANLTRYTRSHPKVALGCSPRATLGLVRAARASAVIAGRPYATPDDVMAVARAVLAHRLILNVDLEGSPNERNQIVDEALERVSFHRPLASRRSG